MSVDASTRAEPVALSWRIKERPGFTTVEFTGEIDENADFGELRRRLRGPVVFHLAEVRRINSCGVREWCAGRLRPCACGQTTSAMHRGWWPIFTSTHRCTIGQARPRVGTT